jgi:hypothetical protein
MKSELRKIARGFDHSLEAFNSYDVNGYRFQTHKYTTSRPNAKTINSGVVCQGDDGLHYYGRVEGIYELNYGFQKGLNPVVFKCHWFDPRRVRRDPEIGLVEVERNSVYKGEDVYILATQAFQVFYLPYACKNPTKRLHGWDVVMKVPSHNRPHGNAGPHGKALHARQRCTARRRDARTAKTSTHGKGLCRAKQPCAQQRWHCWRTLCRADFAVRARKKKPLPCI